MAGSAEDHATQPIQNGRYISIFENYLKMARFNVAESEVLDRCLILNGASASSVATSAIPLNDFTYGESDNMEMDEKTLLQELGDDSSDFGETVSDFSSISFTPKLKDSKIKRWIRAGKKKDASEKGFKIHRISAEDSINHKTIIIQYESDGDINDPDHRARTPRSRQSGAASPKSVRSGGVSPKSVRSGGVSPKSVRSGIASPKSVRSGTVSPKSVRNGVVSPKSPHSKEICNCSFPLKGAKSMNHTRWSEGIEDHDTNGSIGEGSAGTKESSNKPPRTRNGLREYIKSPETSSVSKECDERYLGRNMRAAARKKSRKLRT